VVTPLLECDLLDYIQKNPLDRRLPFASDMAEGLHHLHNEAVSIVHGDLKASNILVSLTGDSPQAMISDFGVSQFGKNSGAGESQAFVGSAYWMAPEQLVDGENSSKETDIWSFGLTLYELLTGGKMPYSEYETIPQLIAAMMRGSAKLSGWSPPPPGRDSELVGPLMLECISWKPDQRPTAAELRGRLLKLYSKEGFNEVRSDNLKDVGADADKARKIRSRGKIDIDLKFALSWLEDLADI